MCMEFGSEPNRAPHADELAVALVEVQHRADNNLQDNGC